MPMVYKNCMDMKRTFAIFAAALLAAALMLPLAGCIKAKHYAMRAEWDGDFCYSVYDDGTVELISYRGTEEVVRVPDNYQGRRLIGFGTKAFDGLETLREVYLPESVSALPAKLFNDCPNFTTVFIPYSVKRIGKNFISECPSFSTVLYGGTTAGWQAVNVGQVPWTDNYTLMNAEIKLNSKPE